MLASASASPSASAAASGNRQHNQISYKGIPKNWHGRRVQCLAVWQPRNLNVECWPGLLCIACSGSTIPRHCIHNAWNKTRAPIADVVRFTAALASLTSICIIINHQMSSGQYVSAVFGPAKRRAGSQKDEESSLPMSAGRAKACTACRQVKVSVFGFHCSTYLFSWRDNSWSAIRPKPFQLLVLDVRARG